MHHPCPYYFFQKKRNSVNDGLNENPHTSNKSHNNNLLPPTHILKKPLTNLVMVTTILQSYNLCHIVGVDILNEKKKTQKRWVAIHISPLLE